MDRLRTEKEIVAKTGLTAASLQNWRRLTKKEHRQIGPVFRKIGKRVYYRLSDVNLFIEREAVVSNRDYGKKRTA